MVSSRDTPGGRAYLDLKKKARAEGRPTDELLALYALEGFLGRLAASEHIDNFVLKGSVLLAAYDTRRPTNDIDVQAQALAIDAARGIRPTKPGAAEPRGQTRSSPVDDDLGYRTSSAA